jgi:hypothetical protein
MGSRRPWNLRLAALLHDMGHVPFCHTLEDEMPVIQKHDAPSEGGSPSRMEAHNSDTANRVTCVPTCKTPAPAIAPKVVCSKIPSLDSTPSNGKKSITFQKIVLRAYLGMVSGMPSYFMRVGTRFTRGRVDGARAAMNPLGKVLPRMFLELDAIRALC